MGSGGFAVILAQRTGALQLTGRQTRRAGAGGIQHEFRRPGAMIRAVDRVLPTTRNLRWTMNKLMLASLSLFLAGAAALPAQAQEQRRWDRDGSGRGEVAAQDEGDREERRAARQERREVVRDERGDRRNPQADFRQTPPVAAPPPQVVQQARQERGVDGRNRGADRRDDRSDWRADRRDDRRDDRSDWRDGRGDDNRYVDRNGRNESRYDNRYDNRYDGRRYDVSRYSRQVDRRWSGNQWYPQYRYRAPVRYVYPRGYRAYQWRVGNRLPVSYYGSNYYVDYNAYRLPPPPYGYHWVRVDRDVVLVSIASGLIRDILYGLYY
jgi:Ni/Co efflux regulator RcnB